MHLKDRVSEVVMDDLGPFLDVISSLECKGTIVEI